MYWYVKYCRKKEREESNPSHWFCKFRGNVAQGVDYYEEKGLKVSHSTYTDTPFYYSIYSISTVRDIVVS